MTPDTPPASVADVAAAGERLRMELLDALRRAPSEAEKSAVMTELMMFYGQAFTRMREASIKQRPTLLPAAQILHECVWGIAVFTIWLQAETPINPQDSYDRMEAHWRKVTGWVLTEEG